MRHIILLAGFLVCFMGRLSAQIEDIPTFQDTLEVYEGLFSLDEPLSLSLKFDKKTFIKTRRAEKYHPAEMTCYVSDNFQVTHPVRIKSRGVWRRDNCSVPPFWINIRYSGIEADSLKNVTKMKMVIRCKSNKLYTNYILREYMVYKIYNLITPISFRVRLIKLKFIDTGKENMETEDWAFLIEPEELMMERLNATIVESDQLSLRTVNPAIIDKVALFQYMIGNGDFSVTGRHNLKILTLKDQSIPGFVPVPYDFDYTGLVDAVYAVPGDGLGIASVRERYFLGLCRDRDEHMAVIKEFATYHDRIVEYIRGFEYLDEKEKTDMIAYIESYFSEAEQEGFIDRKITPTCR